MLFIFVFVPTHGDLVPSSGDFVHPSQSETRTNAFFIQSTNRTCFSFLDRVVPELAENVVVVPSFAWRDPSRVVAGAWR